MAAKSTFMIDAWIAAAIPAVESEMKKRKLSSIDTNLLSTVLVKTWFGCPLQFNIFRDLLPHQSEIEAALKANGMYHRDGSWRFGKPSVPETPHRSAPAPKK